MGSRASTLLRDEEIEEIKKETGFSHSQITRLYSRFTSLDKGENGTLSREDFQRIPELAINPLGDRIINAFFPEGEDQVNFRGFMRTLAHFRPIEDNEKSKDQNGPEPLNSRSNKLYCKTFLTGHLFRLIVLLCILLCNPAAWNLFLFF
ncbi:calcineurin B homologous protein 1 [Podarcis lilfordi]|uniref:Calcineurin B homologous protein 1 n=1 Tax=Podarcis lilfordi TaxID=74358 RepID=A0AA35NWU0_9SAUR|nr:calcineurin B homologous protein 1 [Podarcis lilfordi]